MSAIKCELYPYVRASQLESLLSEEFRGYPYNLRNFLFGDDYYNDSCKLLDIIEKQADYDTLVQSLEDGTLTYVPEKVVDSYYAAQFDGRSYLTEDEKAKYLDALNNYTYTTIEPEMAKKEKAIMDRLVEILNEVHPSPVWVIDVMW